MAPISFASIHPNRAVRASATLRLSATVIIVMQNFISYDAILPLLVVIYEL